MIDKLTAFLSITRPLNCLISFVSVIVAGIICLHGKFPEQIIFLAALSAALTTASGNIINDVFDIEIDKVNRRNRPLPSNKIKIKEAYTYYSFLLVLSVGISVLVSIPVFLIVVLTHFLLFIYSKFLKQISLVGNIIVSFLTGLVFIYGGIVVENPIAAIIPAVFAFLINLIREIVKDIQDVEGDKKVELKTFPIRFGFKTSKILILVTTLILILFTFFPLVTKLYKIEFFILVMVIVNPVLVYCLKILFQGDSLKSLGKISNLLKLGMVIGLIAIYLGV